MSLYPPTVVRFETTAPFSIDGVAFDPPTVTLKYKNPQTGEITTKVKADMVNDSVGKYHYDALIADPGVWWFGFSDGDVTMEDYVEVKDSHFAFS